VLAPTVTVVEDDAELRGLLLRGLREEGFDAKGVATGADLLRAVETGTPDVFVVDVGLPDADGRDLCQALRAQGISAPVLFLSAHGALTDRLAGLNAGGDDYLTKPFAFAELVARLRALLRRSATSGAPQVGTMRLDPTGHAALFDELRVAFTPTEFRLLGRLVSDVGRTVRRRDLIETAWPHGARVRDNTLDAYVARIRRKLLEVDDGPRVTTVHGVGYRLDPGT
jgi:two-component system OmpR family response regulator